MTDRFIELLWRAGATLTGYGSFQTKFAATAVLITIVHFGVKRARGIYRTRKFRAAAAQKRVQCDAVKQHLKEKLHTDDTVVLQKRDEIVKLSAIDLALALKRRHYTAVEVLHAYQAKALEVTERINCVTEFLTEAEQWANDLDEKGPENAGCLFGVPVSIKENVDIKGYPSTAGQVKFLFPVDKDATIVKTLKLQGAVPFVKTNVPQSLLCYDCSNPLYGATTNPVNTARSPGGSSGGEAALLRARGSPLGIGSDIAGSLRIPAHFSGVCALKPTSLRVSKQGGRSSIAGCHGVMVSYGPMGRNVADVALAMKAICSEIMQDIDPLVIPISFREEIYESKRALRIGYFDDNGHVTPTPSCKRAVHLSKEILERQGHELVPFNLPRGGEYGMMLSLRILNADDGRTLLDCWKDEDVDDTVKGVYFLTKLSSKIKAVVGRLLKFVYPRFGTLALQSIGCNDVHTLWKYYNERQLYIDEVMAAWKTAKLDALICPAFSYPALPYGFAHDMLYGATYTVVFNLLDFPAGIVPVTMETKEDQKALDNYPRTDLWDRKIVEATRGATGMPVGVQCVTLPWKEEQCLRVMGDIEAGLDN